jgi:hypothetical protein
VSLFILIKNNIKLYLKASIFVGVAMRRLFLLLFFSFLTMASCKNIDNLKLAYQERDFNKLFHLLTRNPNLKEDFYNLVIESGSLEVFDDFLAFLMQVNLDSEFYNEIYFKLRVSLLLNREVLLYKIKCKEQKCDISEKEIKNLRLKSALQSVQRKQIQSTPSFSSNRLNRCDYRDFADQEHCDFLGVLAFEERIKDILENIKKVFRY